MLLQWWDMHWNKHPPILRHLAPSLPCYFVQYEAHRFTGIMNQFSRSYVL
jgi:hypothetical protein